MTFSQTVTEQGMFVPEHVRYLAGRLTDETPHTDDDFFTSDSSGDYTETDVTGTTTWTVSRGLLSCVFEDQSAADLGTFLKPITSASAPMTIETRVRHMGTEVVNPTSGIIFSDGTISTSNIAGVGFLTSGGDNMRLAHPTGTITSASSNVLTLATHGDLFIRSIWTGTNTFAFAWSIDGVTWTDVGISADSVTMTPTHFGFYVSDWGYTSPCIASFDYLRVYDSDLSV